MILTVLSRVQLFGTPWTIAHQASLSMGFPRQEDQSGHPLLQEVFSTQGSNPGLLHCRLILYHLSHQGSPITCSPTNYLLDLNIPPGFSKGNTCHAFSSLYTWIYPSGNAKLLVAISKIRCSISHTLWLALLLLKG